MRNVNEVQRAHDALVPIVIAEIPVEIHPHDLLVLRGALDALCWVLNHDHNTAFGDNLRRLLEDLEKAGLRLRDSGVLRSGEPS